MWCKGYANTTCIHMKLSFNLYCHWMYTRMLCSKPRLHIDHMASLMELAALSDSILSSLFFSTCFPSLTLAFAPSSALIPFELHDCHKHVVPVPSLPRTPRYSLPLPLTPHPSLPQSRLRHSPSLTHPTPAPSSASTHVIAKFCSLVGSAACTSTFFHSHRRCDRMVTVVAVVDEVSPVSGWKGIEVMAIAKAKATRRCPECPGHPQAEVEVQAQMKLQAHMPNFQDL
jgi:hypothetical protein